MISAANGGRTSKHNRSLSGSPLPRDRGPDPPNPITSGRNPIHTRDRDPRSRRLPTTRRHRSIPELIHDQRRSDLTRTAQPFEHLATTVPGPRLSHRTPPVHTVASQARPTTASLGRAAERNINFSETHQRVGRVLKGETRSACSSL